MLWEHIAANRRRTVLLFLVFFLLMGALGWALSIALGNWYGAAFMMGLAGVIALVSLTASEKLVLAYTHAREATPEEYRQLSHLVEGLAIAAQIPAPRCYVIRDDAPNAFATGLPGKGTICVTTGLLQKMERQELEGVVAHEMAHIANHDTRVMTIAFVLAGLVAIVSDMAMRSLRWGGLGGGRRRSSRKDSGGGAQALLLVVAVVVIILAPIAAKLLTMAVSRRREYLADAEAVRLTRNPWGLANALRKIAGDPDPVDSASLATAHLFISNPLRQGMFSANWFSTHPPIHDRIARLEKM